MKWSEIVGLDSVVESAFPSERFVVLFDLLFFSVCCFMLSILPVYAVLVSSRFDPYSPNRISRQVQGESRGVLREQQPQAALDGVIPSERGRTESSSVGKQSRRIVKSVSDASP